MNVTLPDGTVIEDVPEGTTKTQLIGKLQKGGYDVSGLIRQTAAQETVGEMSGTQRFLAGAGKAMTDIARGVGQMVGISDDAAIAESRQRDAPLTQTGAGLSGNIVGGMATASPAMLIPGANTLVGSSLVGAGFGATQPTIKGESRVVNSMLGGAGGALGYGAGRGISKVISPAGGAAAPPKALAEAQKLGARVTPGAATGNTALRQIEASAESFPITSGPFAAIKSQNQTVLNRAAAKAIGENADAVTGDVLTAARTRIGNEFAKVEQLNQIPVGTQVQNKFAAIEMKYRGLLNDKSLADFDIVRDVYNNLGGTITGKQYNNWQSQLGKIARSKFSGEGSKPQVGFALFEVKNALDDAASAAMTGPQKQAFDQARQQWRNLVMLESGNVVNEQTGNVSGKLLKNVLSRKDKSGFRMGGNASDLYNMARFEKAFPDVVGNSGTATRSALPDLLKAMGYTGVVGGIGGTAVDPTNQHSGGLAGAGIGVAAPLLAAALARGGAGVYAAPIMQPYLTNQLLGPVAQRGVSGLGALLGANAYVRAGQ